MFEKELKISEALKLIPSKIFSFYKFEHLEIFILNLISLFIFSIDLKLNSRKF